MMEHIRQQAESGAKFLPGENASVRKDNYHFFYNRVVLGDNTIIVKLEGKVILYLAYDVLNYMITQDEAFCQDILFKVNTLMKKATMISNASDKQRNIFFNILLRKIPETVNNLKSFS